MRHLRGSAAKADQIPTEEKKIPKFNSVKNFKILQKFSRKNDCKFKKSSETFFTLPEMTARDNGTAKVGSRAKIAVAGPKCLLTS
jgi:hypothetical protein